MTNDARSILRGRGIRPQKRFGQSFLKDDDMIDRIVEAATLSRDDIVVEIGAGLGIMTERIADRSCLVAALELDPYLLNILRDRLKARQNVEIIASDVLKFDIASFRRAHTPGKLKIIGNIPYNISTPLLFHLLNYRAGISSMIMMFQRELAERLTAKPGTKQYGIPTVIAGMYADIVRMFDVPPSCFYPPPKVDSSVLKFVMLDESRFALKSDKAFTGVVRQAFSQRRKTLRNNFRTAFLTNRCPGALENAFMRARIDGRRRAETLSIEEFARLTEEIC